MAYHFRRGDREQPFPLPPDLRDWLAQDHLAWFVLCGQRTIHATYPQAPSCSRQVAALLKEGERYGRFLLVMAVTIVLVK
jgi:hypothetical protein